MQKRPGLRERKAVSERIISKIKAFVEIFIDGVDLRGGLTGFEHRGDGVPGDC